MDTIEDGFGSVWTKCERSDCALEVVRPGKCQCSVCDSLCGTCGGEITYHEMRNGIEGYWCNTCQGDWFKNHYNG